MKCYYPTDKSGNRIGFKTPEACIYDTSGTNLTNKLNQLRSDVNGKAAANHGTHVPAPQAANNKIYLRNDNTWHTITPGDIGAAASSHSHSWDSITGKPSLYTTSQIDSKVNAINSNISNNTQGVIWTGRSMVIIERKNAYPSLNSAGRRVLGSIYDIYIYGTWNLNITNNTARAYWTFVYDGKNAYSSRPDTYEHAIPYKYLYPNSLLSITGFIVNSTNDTTMKKYYPLPYFESEDNPGSGLDIASVYIESTPTKTGSALLINLNKHTHSGTWKSDGNSWYYYYFKLESMGSVD